MLADDLKTLLATSYAFVIKAQNFHWNVEGSDFSQYHQFFQGIYDEVYGNAIDQTAEYIRVKFIKILLRTTLTLHLSLN